MAAGEVLDGSTARFMTDSEGIRKSKPIVGDRASAWKTCSTTSKLFGPGQATYPSLPVSPPSSYKKGVQVGEGAQG